METDSVIVVRGKLYKNATDWNSAVSLHKMFASEEKFNAWYDKNWNRVEITSVKHETL